MKCVLSALHSSPPPPWSSLHTLGCGRAFLPPLPGAKLIQFNTDAQDQNPYFATLFISLPESQFYKMSLYNIIVQYKLSITHLWELTYTGSNN